MAPSWFPLCLTRKNINCQDLPFIGAKSEQESTMLFSTLKIQKQ